MKPRRIALTIPEDNDRYFSVERENADILWLRTPNGGKLSRLVEWVGEAHTGHTSASISTSAAAIGLFWSDRGSDLEAKPPSAKDHRGADGMESWDEYSDAVIDELEDAGFSTRQILDIGETCMARCNVWIESLKVAQDQADFTPPPEDSTTA